MAKQILAGTPVTNIPIQTDSPNNYIYDYNQLQKFGLTLKDLPKEASVLNKPLSFYEENKSKRCSTLRCCYCSGNPKQNSIFF